MTKTMYRVELMIDGEWVKIAKLYPNRKAALKAVEECSYAPEEYKIVMIEKEI